MCEEKKVDGMEQKKRGIASERVQSGESDTASRTDGQGGLSLHWSLPLSLYLAPSLSLIGRLTLLFIRLTGHRRGDE